MHPQEEIEGHRNEDRAEGKADGGTDGGRRVEKSGEWAERVAVNQKKEGSRDGGREVRSARWRERAREREQSRAGQQQWRRRIKMCGEVMAVMNSPWLIGGSQVGV